MKLKLHIKTQPDNSTCGPTCLHAVYNYFGDHVSLEQVVEETPRMANGGAMGVDLACHALRRGYSAKIFSYNLQLFDPTWEGLEKEALIEKLELQAREKPGRIMRAITKSYSEFLRAGGTVEFEDLTAALIRKYLKKGVPILTGLSATYLYDEPREMDKTGDENDIAGSPTGHFVVLCGYDREERTVAVADPLHKNPFSETKHYEVSIDTLVCSILLGVLTYDANLLIIQPGHGRKK